MHTNVDMLAYELYCESRNPKDEGYSCLCTFDYFIYKKNEYQLYYDKVIRKEKLKELNEICTQN